MNFLSCGSAVDSANRPVRAAVAWHEAGDVVGLSIVHVEVLAKVLDGTTDLNVP